MGTQVSRAAILSVVGLLGVVGALGCTADTESSTAAQEITAPTSQVSDLYAGSPYLGELRNSLVYGEIWERPQLSKRDRSLITLAVLQALVRDELRLHIPRGLDKRSDTGGDFRDHCACDLLCWLADRCTGIPPCGGGVRGPRSVFR